MVKKLIDQWDKRKQHTRGREEFGVDSPYDEDAHRVWCAEENFGVGHTGEFPEDYDISKIFFDVFHGQSADFKVFLKYLCTILEGIPRNINFVKGFLSILPE